MSDSVVVRGLLNNRYSALTHIEYAPHQLDLPNRTEFMSPHCRCLQPLFMSPHPGRYRITGGQHRKLTANTLGVDRRYPMLVAFPNENRSWHV